MYQVARLELPEDIDDDGRTSVHFLHWFAPSTLAAGYRKIIDEDGEEDQEIDFAIWQGEGGGGDGGVGIDLSDPAARVARAALFFFILARAALFFFSGGVMSAPLPRVVAPCVCRRWTAGVSHGVSSHRLRPSGECGARRAPRRHRSVLAAAARRAPPLPRDIRCRVGRALRRLLRLEGRQDRPLRRRRALLDHLRRCARAEPRRLVETTTSIGTRRSVEGSGGRTFQRARLTTRQRVHLTTHAPGSPHDTRATLSRPFP